MKSIIKVTLLTLLIFVSGCSSSMTEPEQKSSVIVNNNKFFVDTAITYDEQIQGLQNVSKLDKNKGMLFVNNEEKMRTFWMYKTLISLDIIFIDKDLNIINIETANPCNETDSALCPRYSSSKPAQYILEINANLSQKLDINPQDKIVINLK